MADESNLIAHARRELEIIGEEPATIEGYLKVIQAFADMGHSGGSASIAIPVITQLLMQKPLSALTDYPDDWQYHGEDTWGAQGGIWQSKRDSTAFSNDGGKTFYWLRPDLAAGHSDIVASEPDKRTAATG